MHFQEHSHHLSRLIWENSLRSAWTEPTYYPVADLGPKSWGAKWAGGPKIDFRLIFSGQMAQTVVDTLQSSCGLGGHGPVLPHESPPLVLTLFHNVNLFTKLN